MCLQLLKVRLRRGRGRKTPKTNVSYFILTDKHHFRGCEKKQERAGQEKKNNRRTETALVLQVYTMLLLLVQNHSRSGKKGEEERKDTSPLQRLWSWLMLHIPTGLRSVAVRDVDSVLKVAGLKWAEELKHPLGKTEQKMFPHFSDWFSQTPQCQRDEVDKVRSNELVGQAGGGMCLLAACKYQHKYH